MVATTAVCGVGGFEWLQWSGCVFGQRGSGVRGGDATQGELSAG